MKKEYERVYNAFKLRRSSSYLCVIESLLRDLPKIEELNDEWVMGYLSSFDNEGTRHNKHGMLSSVLRELGMSDVMKNIKVAKPKFKLKPSELLTAEEVSSMFRSCSNLEEKAILEFMLESGCRIGEILSIETQDVEIKENFVIVTVRGKTGQRTIPLVKNHLDNFLVHLGYATTDRIFNLCYSAFYRRLADIYKRADVRKRKRITHIFRHMKATNLIELGVPESIIKQFMGWSYTSTIIHVYTHLTPKNIQSYFERMLGMTTEPVKSLYPTE